MPRATTSCCVSLVGCDCACACRFILQDGKLKGRRGLRALPSRSAATSDDSAAHSPAPLLLRWPAEGWEAACPRHGAPVGCGGVHAVGVCLLLLRRAAAPLDLLLPPPLLLGGLGLFLRGGFLCLARGFFWRGLLCLAECSLFCHPNGVGACCSVKWELGGNQPAIRINTASTVLLPCGCAAARAQHTRARCLLGARAARATQRLSFQSGGPRAHVN